MNASLTAFHMGGKGAQRPGGDKSIAGRQPGDTTITKKKLLANPSHNHEIKTHFAYQFKTGH
jgi:hypothetical protein